MEVVGAMGRQGTECTRGSDWVLRDWATGRCRCPTGYCPMSRSTSRGQPNVAVRLWLALVGCYGQCGRAENEPLPEGPRQLHEPRQPHVLP